ncbi:MAG: hypothetical protein ACU0GG_12245 [Paracoccaceae bacterium]
MLRTLSKTAALALVGTAALASDTHIIEDIDVQFEVESIESEVAAEFWSDLEGDLEEAILSRVADQLGENGSEITIDIDELAISNSFEGALGTDSTLLAAVAIENETDPTKNSFYDLKVTVDESGSFQTEDGSTAIVTHEREAVYEAVVNTFADGVVKRLY